MEIVTKKLHEVTPLVTPCLLLLLHRLGMGRNNLRKILTFLKLSPVCNCRLIYLFQIVEIYPMFGKEISREENKYGRKKKV